MSHNRDLSAAAGQFGFHSSNIGIGSEAPQNRLDVAGDVKILDNSPRLFLYDANANGASNATGGFEVFDKDGNKNVFVGAFAPNADNLIFGVTGTERLRITSDGKVGVGVAAPSQMMEITNTSGTGAQIQMRDTSTAQGNNNGLRVGYNGSGGQLWNFESTYLRFATSNTERLRIDANGTLLVNSAIDNTGGHGQIVAHAPTSGNTIYKAIEIGNTDGDGTARGAAICGQPKANGHLPYTLIGSWDHGDNTDVYYGGGWGGAMRPATRHRFYTNSSYPTTGTSGTEVVRITENGDLGINILDPQEKLHVHILKNSGTTSTTRTKQHAAMRLSLQRNGGSAPYYGWGPALDFYSDNYDGSTRRPNARIAGVISNSSVDHEGGQLRFYTTANDTATSETDFIERMRIYADGIVTKPYQPAFFVYRNQSAWSLAANDHFIFNTAELNVGNHYNTSNGRFTAPITGRYVFHFFSIYTGNANSDSIEMYKNGSRMYGGDVHFTNSIGSAWDCVHYSRVIQLSSGDYVHMQTRTGHTFHGNHWGGWSGYMLG